MAKIEQLEKDYFSQPSDSLFQELMATIGSEIVNTNQNSDKIELIKRGIKVSDKAQKENYRLVFIVEFLKANPQGAERADYLFEVGESQLYSERKDVASVLFKAFVEKFPNHKKVEEAKKHILAQHEDLESFMKKSVESVLIQPDTTGINPNAAVAFIDLSEAYAMAYPEKDKAPVYLFTAAELARSMKSLPKMMNLYDWIIQYHPSFKKAPLVLFLKGFALENEFVRLEDARKTYELFLSRYPKDSLAGNVTLLLSQLGKNPMDVIKEDTKPALQ